MKTRLEKIKDANKVLNHNNPAWKEELDWLIEQAEKVERYRDFIEQIAGRVYDSPNIPHEEIVTDAQGILAKEMEK